MARQNPIPLPIPRTTRVDRVAATTTGRAGLVTLVDYFPVLRGDAVGGSVAYDIVLNHMPKPLRNSVVANVQSWFVPHSIHPRFRGEKEYMYAYRGENIMFADADGVQQSVAPVPLFAMHGSTARQQILASDHVTTLGVHVPDEGQVNDVILDAYTLVWNFRAQAHSDRIALRVPAKADLTAACKFARAFWPQNRYSRVVPDYEKALILGNVSLDVLAGQLPVKGIHNQSSVVAPTEAWTGSDAPSGRVVAVQNQSTPGHMSVGLHEGTERNLITFVQKAPDREAAFDLYAEMAGSKVDVTLQDIDMARKMQAWARYRTSLHGNNPTGFINDDAIMAELMSGLDVPAEEFDRPVLLGSQMQRFSMVERPAMDGPSLDMSTSRGRVAGSIPVNVPQQPWGGVVIVTVEVLPERIYERQFDRYLRVATLAQLPDALRDMKRTEPVDIVPRQAIDVTAPAGAYGYEPMNDRWNREFTRLGGAFYQTSATPDWSEVRSAFWLPEIVDPIYSEDHFLAPDPFPHDVFADTDGPAFELTLMRSCAIRGLTQIGEPLIEDGGDFAAIAE